MLLLEIQRLPLKFQFFGISGEISNLANLHIAIQFLRSSVLRKPSSKISFYFKKEKMSTQINKDGMAMSASFSPVSETKCFNSDDLKSLTPLKTISPQFV
jgi:hypothetical protein